MSTKRQNNHKMINHFYKADAKIQQTDKMRCKSKKANDYNVKQNNCKVQRKITAKKLNSLKQTQNHHNEIKLLHGNKMIINIPCPPT